MIGWLTPDRRLIAASSVACGVGTAGIFLQPLLMVEMLAARNMSEASAALVLTVEMLAVALASMLGARLLRGASFFHLMIAATLLAALGDAASLITSSDAVLIAARILCGVGEGIALLVSTAAPARLAAPDRAYAQINGVSIVVGSVLIWLSPSIGRLVGGPMVFPTMLLCFLVLLPLHWLMPPSERLASLQPGREAAEESGASARIFMIWLGVFVLVTANAAVFSFAVVLGQAAGLTPEGADETISIATAASLLGSAAAGFLGTRLGRLMPIAAGIALVALAITCLSSVRIPAIFYLSANLQMIGDYFLVPYFEGAAAMEDPTGRGAAAVYAAIPLSYAVGPFFGGEIAERFGFAMLGWIAAAMCFVALALLASTQAPVRLGRRRGVLGPS